MKVLSRVFRGKFTAGLKKAFRKRELSFPGALQPLAQEPAFRSFLRSLFRQDWVVYVKPAFGGPLQVLRYLGRYTHRIASRIIACSLLMESVLRSAGATMRTAISHA